MLGSCRPNQRRRQASCIRGRCGAGVADAAANHLLPPARNACSGACTISRHGPRGWLQRRSSSSSSAARKRQRRLRCRHSRCCGWCCGCCWRARSARAGRGIHSLRCWFCRCRCCRCWCGGCLWLSGQAGEQILVQRGPARVERAAGLARLAAQASKAEATAPQPQRLQATGPCRRLGRVRGWAGTICCAGGGAPAAGCCWLQR